MERSKWGECTLRNPDSCNMPNKKRTPDIAVRVICQLHEDSVSYPLLIGEILGKKEPGSQNEQRFKGYNAALQALVFAPHGYYWEIPVTDAKMYKLERNPSKGQIITLAKTYKLASCSDEGVPLGITEMIRDICHVFFDGPINLRPIADHSAHALYAANYREFLSCSLEGGRNIPIQTHCWHICTPRASSWNDNDPPQPFHAGDAEDPEQPVTQKRTIAESRFAIPDEGCVVPVNEEAFDYCKLAQKHIKWMTPIRAIRNPDGTPLDATRENLNLDEDTSAHRINAQLITLQTCDYLAAFSERATRNELAVFDQNFNKTIQNMTLCGLTPAPDDLLQAQHETEQEEGEEDIERQVVCKFEDFHNDTSLIEMQLRQQPREGAITAAYVNNKVVIKGPLGKSFEGGFEILRSGHLVHMDRVTQLDTVEGFTSGSKLMIDLQLWKFLQYAAKLCGDKNANEGFGEPAA